MFLVDPATRRLEAIGALTKPELERGHGQGATSADARADTLFVADRTARRLFAIPLGGSGTAAEAPLASGPDYVRWVEPTGEVWVTEPDAAAIEIFRFEAKEKPTLVRSGSIAVADGPESLIIDAAHGRVFTNTRHDRTLAIGLRERSVVAEWKNGCKDARGLDADRIRGLLFVGCAEGLATVIDTSGKGRLAGQARTGAGGHRGVRPVDSQALRSGGKAATLEAFEVSRTEACARSGGTRRAGGALRGRRRPGSCRGVRFARGRLLMFEDPRVGLGDSPLAAVRSPAAVRGLPAGAGLPPLRPDRRRRRRAARG